MTELPPQWLQAMRVTRWGQFLGQMLASLATLAAGETAILLTSPLRLY